MQAKETKLQDIIEGTKQYVVPLFQRTYSWTKNEWEVLWKDLIELCEADNPRSHFIGSIVTMPTVSVPEGVAKFLLIDGQQRLTTIFVLLTLLRNKATENQNQEFAEEINNTLLVNPYKKDNDYFKLIPTQVDRETYKSLINRQSAEKDCAIAKAYSYFEKKLKQVKIEHERLKKIITNYFSVVSIVLDADDNPYLVFESLNAKGKPLTQADLIRNYFFMRIPVDKQEEIYNDSWGPMQTSLNDALTEYIRHFLMRSGSFVKQSDVYYSLKDNVTPENVITYLKELKTFSVYYQRLIDPTSEPEPDLRKYFLRLNKIEVTTAYPLLLNLYGAYVDNKISKADFVAILKTLENYLIRRFVCSEPTNQHNKIFPAVYPQLIAKYQNNLLEGFKTILQEKNYPKDNEFLTRFKDIKFYGGGDRLTKTKLVLESLEESFSHKETVSFDNLTIEHIMPQTLSTWWQDHLGEEWQEIHELYKHTIGNLTLTAYNTELSNDDYHAKKKTYRDSHLELNKYFLPIPTWTRNDIENRADVLAQKALEIWNYFGQENSVSERKQVTGTTPTSLKILGQKIVVQSWRDVLEQTLSTLADLEPDKFEVITHAFPRFVSKDKTKFRAIRQLQNGYFIEVHLPAQSIQRFCEQAMNTVELTSGEWEVTTT